jgi:beta-N-acetylhexosaminidase
MVRRTANDAEGRPLLLAGFEGTFLPPSLARRLSDGTVSGVVLFSRNVEGPVQVRELCRAVRGAAPPSLPPPLVAVDQEGGRVRRFSRPPFTSLPPARSWSLLPDGAAAAEAAGRGCGEELRAVGCDVDFAPVLDVDSNPENPVIGDRAFSSDPEGAAALALAFARGLSSAGVLPVGKHFPGHGDTRLDSHLDLPRVEASARDLSRRELLPFRRAAAAGLPALMSAHVVYPALDPDLPATLSRKILTGLLRRRLRYRGLLFSDALEMKALSDRWGMGETALGAVRAGCDALLVCRGEELVEEAAEALSRALRDDPSFRREGRRAALKGSAFRALLPKAPRPPLSTLGRRSHREAARRGEEAWERSGRALPGGRSGSIGEG